METYAKALSFAIPFFLVLILIEFIASKIMKFPVNTGMDTISSLSSGMTNTLKSLLGLSVVIVSYDMLLAYLSITRIESSVLLYVLAFIGIDFAGYWSHRFNHTINVFWNRHIIHHSSEEFNLSCALRQEVSAIIGIYFFLYIPLAFLGVPTEVLAIVAPIHLFAQFWYHTRLIDKMGFLEKILVTPSHHRVHHAINDIYIDKNYAQIFIVWDKWFGTFQEELPDEQPVYGVKKAVRTWNPILINFMHFWQLLKDAWHTRYWWDKVRLWFMPTGWRPNDVAERYPIDYTKDVHNRPKYTGNTSKVLLYFSWFQLIVHLLFLIHLLTQIHLFSFQEVVGYSIFLFLSIFAYTSLMDGFKGAVFVEILKVGLGFFLLLRTDIWASPMLGYGAYLLAVYLAFSISFYFTAIFFRAK